MITGRVVFADLPLASIGRQRGQPFHATIGRQVARLRPGSRVGRRPTIVARYAAARVGRVRWANRPERRLEVALVLPRAA